MRYQNRAPGALRPITLELGCNKHAEGSCRVNFGDTQVICTVSFENKVPPFLKNSGTGWVTAEYGMLPRSTNTRMDREATRGSGQNGRTHEIQRLIGRAMRSIIDLKVMGEKTLKIDCDVIQADGGTRTAAITGAYVALHQACTILVAQKKLPVFPIRDQVAAISCGIVNGEVLVDLDYQEDSTAETDANFVMTGSGRLIEVQATAEKEAFDRTALMGMLALAEAGVKELMAKQQQVLGL